MAGNNDRQKIDGDKIAALKNKYKGGGADAGASANNGAGASANSGMGASVNNGAGAGSDTGAGAKARRRKQPALAKGCFVTILAVSAVFVIFYVLTTHSRYFKFDSLPKFVGKSPDGYFIQWPFGNAAKKAPRTRTSS